MSEKDYIFWPIGKKEGVVNIRSKLIEIALDSNKLQVPKSYMKLLEQITLKRIQMKNETPILEWGSYRDWALSVTNIEDEEQLQRATQQLHYWGEVIHLRDKSWTLGQRVVIHPQWLSNLLVTVISVKHNPTSKEDPNENIISNNNYPINKAPDKVYKSDLEARWKDEGFSPSIFPYLLELLEVQYQIIILKDKHRKSIDPEYIIPCLLSDSQPSNVTKLWNNYQVVTTTSNPSLDQVNSKYIIQSIYRDYYLPFEPSGFMSRLLIQLTDVCSEIVDAEVLHYWRKGMLLSYHQQLAIIELIEDGSSLFGVILRVEVQGMKKEIVLSQVHFVVQRILSGWYPGVQYSNKFSIHVGLRMNENITIDMKREDCLMKLLNGDRDILLSFGEMEEISIGIDILLPELLSNSFQLKREVILQSKIEGIRTRFDKDIVLLKRLSEGGFGQVWKANWQGKPVALKFIKIDSSNLGIIDEFCKEVEILHLLDHPNIVKIFDYYPVPPSLVMEYVEGGDLETILHNPKISLNWKQLIRIAREIASAVNYMHSFNPPLLHCDLRTPNILVESLSLGSGIMIKIADLGNANFTDRYGKGGGLFSTYTDIHQFSCILFELIEKGEESESSCPKELTLLFQNIKDLKFGFREIRDALVNLESSIIDTPRSSDDNIIDLNITTLKQDEGGDKEIKTFIKVKSMKRMKDSNYNLKEIIDDNENSENNQKNNQGQEQRGVWVWDLIISVLYFGYFVLCKLLQYIYSKVNKKHANKEQEINNNNINIIAPNNNNNDSKQQSKKENFKSISEVAVLSEQELEIEMQKKLFTKLCDDLTISINTYNLADILNQLKQLKKLLILMKRLHKIPKALDIHFFRIMEILYSVIDKGEISYIDQILSLKLLNINNYMGQHPYSLVQYTCSIGNNEILKCLISHGANCNLGTTKNETPLHLCCSMGFSNCIPILLDINVDPNAKTTSGSTPLHRAAQGGHFNCISELTRCIKVKVNEVDNYGETPLMRAASVPHIECMELLLLHGAVFMPAMMNILCVKDIIVKVVQNLLKSSEISITAQTTISQMKPFFASCGGDLLRVIQEDSSVFGSEINLKISSYEVNLGTDKDIVIQNNGKSNLDIVIRLPYSPTYKINISPAKFLLKKVCSICFWVNFSFS